MDAEQRAAAIVSELLYQWLKGAEPQHMDEEPLLVEIADRDEYGDVLSELRRIRDEMLKRADA